MDFGVACKYLFNKNKTTERRDMLTRTGTLHYKAPEMFETKYNESVDIWAIGVITFEIL